MKKVFLGIVFCLALLSLPAVAQEAKKPIKIGYINAQTNGSYFTYPSGHGIKLAIEEINAKGGVLGRPLELFSRDSKMDPAEAVRLAEELVSRDKVDALLMADSSGPTVAVAEWVQKNHVPLVSTTGGSDNIIWKNGSDYVVRTNFGGYPVDSGVIKKAIEIYGDKLKNKRWALVAQNFEIGRLHAQMIKKVVKEQKLNANWVGEQWPAYNKLVAGPVIAALEQDKPDVIFSVLVGSDLVKFVREARKRGFIKDRIFIFPYLSMPEHYKMIGKEVPKGWLTMGAPYNEQALKKPVLAAFMKRYEAAYHEPIKDYSISGYNGVKVLAAAMTKAGSTDPKKVAAAFDDLRFATPLGEETIRKIDHQATTAFWVGLSDFIDGKPSIRNWTEYNVNDNLPPDAYILKIRNKK